MIGTRSGGGTGRPIGRDNGNGNGNGREQFSTSRSVGNLPNYSSPWESEKSDRAMTYGRNNGFEGNKNNGYDNLRSNVFDGTRSLNLTPRLSTGPPSPINSDGRGRQNQGQGLFGNMSLNTTQGFGGRERGSVSSSGRGGRQGDVLYDHVMASVIERVAIAAIDRSRALGSPFSLLKQFQVYDDGYGSVSEKVFESTIGRSG